MEYSMRKLPEKFGYKYILIEIDWLKAENSHGNWRTNKSHSSMKTNLSLCTHNAFVSKYGKLKLSKTIGLHWTRCTLNVRYCVTLCPQKFVIMIRLRTRITNKPMMLKYAEVEMGRLCLQTKSVAGAEIW